MIAEAGNDFFPHKNTIYNKRALGRSSEENVKGHSGAVYRGPLLMQPTGMVWTTLVEDHLEIIPVKFGQSNERFERRRCLSKIVDGQQTTHDGRRRTTDKGWSQ